MSQSAAPKHDAIAQASPGLIEIVEQVLDIAKSDRVTLREVVAAIGNAGFAPILLLPALAVATPMSGIPLFSSLMGIVIFLVSTQMIVRRRQLWLPGWVLRRDVGGQAVTNAFTRVLPVAAWLDARTGRRLQPVVRRPLVFIPQLLCIISGACMPLLEFVPFSSSILGVGVTILAFGMLSRDGLVVVIGLVPYGLLGCLIYIGAT